MSEGVGSLLESLVGDGLELGLQVAAFLDGELVVDQWAGLAARKPTRKVDGDTLFTGFSTSKGLTATCIHLLVDRGLLAYNTRVSEVWPEFGSEGKDNATVLDVLNHRLGIPQEPDGFDLGMASDWEATCAAIAALPPLWEPGTKTAYHPLTAGWVAGELVRRIDGRPLELFVQEEICRPFKLDRLWFGVPSALEAEVADLENAPGLRELGLSPALSDLADTFNRPEVRRACVPGAGMLVNARSLAAHYAMLAGFGEFNGVRLLTPEVVASAIVPQDDPDPQASCWWEVQGVGYILSGSTGPMAGRPGSFGYEGLGTIGFANPSRRFSFALLKNRLDWSSNEMNTVNLVLNAAEEELGIA